MKAVVDPIPSRCLLRLAPLSLKDAPAKWQSLQPHYRVEGSGFGQKLNKPGRYPPGSPAMYSSHRIDSVTCLRLSSRCTAAQSGSACRRWPCRVPAPAPANSRASSSVSVTSSVNGQVSPAASNRRIVDRTVDGAAPTRRAISRVGNPADINPEWWARSNRNGGRDHSGMVGDIERNQHLVDD